MREKIIDTAIEEFTRNGLKFTMNDVAKALGISKKTIYTVFESKQDVLMAIAETGVKSIQLHTGGMCHLDAEMTRQGVEGLGVADVDLAILENVGNLVCPAEFDTGASKNVMILSVPEGHDKPLKYPLMFQICDAVLINKIDVLPYFDFDMERVKEYIHQRNPQAEVFPISAKTGEGMDAWTEWLAAQVTEWKK